MQKPCYRCKQSGWPLKTAVQQGHFDCLDSLVKEGASVDDKSEAFCSALACENFKCAEFLLDTGINVNFKGYRLGVTPLMCAVLSDRYLFKQNLIAEAANVNSVSIVRSGALHHSRSRECTQLLTCKGADVNLKDHNSVTPLHSAITLYESTDYGLPLMSAGADVNAKCKKGEMPLMKSASIGNVQIIELLLEKGADVNAFDSLGRNALYHAAKRGNNRVILLLLSRGADVNAVHPNMKQYSLIAAVSSGHKECMKILFQAGADVNALDTNSQSPLILASVGNRLDFVKLLFQAGAVVRIPHEAGCSALQIYVLTHLFPWLPKCDTEMVRFLYAAGEKKEGLSQRTINEVKSHGTWVSRYLPGEHQMEYIQLARQHLSDDPTLCLKDICRQTVREHLLQMSQVNLFIRIPHLGLPASLARYLLYDVSLESP